MAGRSCRTAVGGGTRGGMGRRLLAPWRGLWASTRIAIAVAVVWGVVSAAAAAAHTLLH